MATLIVPRLDDEPWPTLGPQVVAFLQERSIYGPGSLKGEPYVVDPEFRALLYRAYEVYPKWHEWAGRRRFRRVAWSVRKGLAKCLAPDTPVLLACGRTVRADRVVVGDEVLGYAEGALTPALVGALAPAADFIAVGPEIWTTDDPAKALAALVERLG